MTDHDKQLRNSAAMPAGQPHDELLSSTAEWLRRAMDGIKRERGCEAGGGSEDFLATRPGTRDCMRSTQIGRHWTPSTDAIKHEPGVQPGSGRDSSQRKPIAIAPDPTSIIAATKPGPTGELIPLTLSVLLESIGEHDVLKVLQKVRTLLFLALLVGNQSLLQ
jgi:hypothetical protein